MANRNYAAVMRIARMSETGDLVQNMYKNMASVYT